MLAAWSRAAEADRTPASRNRYVDFLRAVSMLVVTAGTLARRRALLRRDQLTTSHVLRSLLGSPGSHGSCRPYRSYSWSADRPWFCRWDAFTAIRRGPCNRQDEPEPRGQLSLAEGRYAPAIGGPPLRRGSGSASAGARLTSVKEVPAAAPYLYDNRTGDLDNRSSALRVGDQRPSLPKARGRAWRASASWNRLSSHTSPTVK
jgi:hypothetical protein